MRTTLEPSRNVLRACFTTFVLIWSIFHATIYSQPIIQVDNLHTSDCYAQGTQSFVYVQMELSWENLSSDESISLSLAGVDQEIALQYPVLDRRRNEAEHLPLVSPQMVSFELPADGLTYDLEINYPDYTSDDQIQIRLPKPCQKETCSAQDHIGGRVYFDQGADGPGIHDLTVELRSCDGSAPLSTAITDIEGHYSFGDIDPSKEYQIVFQLDPNSELYESDLGYNRVVRDILGTNCNTDLALIRSNSLTSEEVDLDIYVSCFVHGEPVAGSNDDTEALLTVPFSEGGYPSVIATASEVGSLWGIAWDEQTETLYSSAVLRRHSGYGPLGAAGIYRYEPGEKVVPWLDLSFGGAIDFGDLIDNSERALAKEARLPAEDALAWSRVGRVGIGDIDLSTDGQYLFVTNLASQSLIAVEIDADDNPDTPPSRSDVTEYSIPTPCGNAGVARPWGLSVHEGQVYVGVTCDASLSDNASDLRAYVYTFDIAARSFGPAVIDFPLTYSKGSQAVHIDAFRICGEWRPWNDDYTTWCYSDGFYASPQPLLSDIEFTSDGSMVLGFLDRSAYMLGADDLLPDGSGYEAAIASAGDVLIANKIGDRYYLESGGKTNKATGQSDNNSQGPGGGEFFEDSYQLPDGNLIHSEMAFGALAVHEGLDELLFTAVDPETFSEVNFSGGIRWHSTDDGSYKRAKILYNGTARPFVGKSAGLGDLEIARRNKATIEIGDYVWLDDNLNGIQDPCEEPLSDLKVCLLDVDGTELASTITDENGHYAFHSDDIAELKAGNKLIISFGCDEDINENGEILTSDGILQLTEHVDVPHVSSSAVLEAGRNSICFEIDEARNVYHFDAGFVRTQTTAAGIIDVQLTKTLINEPRRYGDTALYVIEITNQGEVPLKNLLIGDFKPDGLEFLSDINEGWSAVEPDVLAIGIEETIQPGQVKEIPILLRVNDKRTKTLAYLNISEILYMEDLNGENVSDKDVDSRADANPHNDVVTTGAVLSDLELFEAVITSDGEDDHDFAFLNLNDISLEKEVANDDGPFQIGEDVEYVITVRNEGNVPVEQVLIADYPSDGLVLSPNDYVGWFDSGDGSLLNAIQGPIEPGEQVSIPIILSVHSSASRVGTDILVNNAEVLSALDAKGNEIQDFDSEAANIDLQSNGSLREDDESSASITLLALSAADCSALATRNKVNVSMGNNCLTKIDPGYIFSGNIPAAADIVRYEFLDTNGVIMTDSIIPQYFVNQCIEVTAFVDCTVDTMAFSSILCLEDKDPPNIMCPLNDTISCTEESLPIFTGFVADCNSVDTLLVHESSTEISTGPYLRTIEREWQLRDALGNTSPVCVQTVMVRRLDFTSELSIPDDITLSCDAVGGINADISPIISGQVTVGGMVVGPETKLCNVSAIYTDKVILDSPCKKVTLRNWTINEWRDGKDSILEPVQAITIVDTTAPIITTPFANDTIRISTNNHFCSENVTLPAVSYTDGCDSTKVRVDMFTPSGAFIGQNGGEVALPVDTNVIYYVVQDSCHNSVRDTLIVIVSDGFGPLTLCESSIEVDIPTTGSGTTVPASRFDFKSVDACHGPLTRAVRHMDSTLFSPDIYFDCDDIGDTIMVMLQITDERGNSSTCMIATRVTGDSTICNSLSPLVLDLPDAEGFDIGGLVFNPLGIGIPDVSIDAGEYGYVETDYYGDYYLGYLESGGDYDIVASLDSDFGLGISTLDMIKIQRHILGIEPITDEYLLMAADIDQDGDVGSRDLVMLRMYILGIQDFPSDDVWMFFSDTQPDDPMGHHVINALAEREDVDFVGVKIGDVNGDAVDDLLTGSRSNEEMPISYDIIDLGGFKEISFMATSDLSVSGLQWIFDYNPEVLKIRNVNGAKLHMSPDHFNISTEGKIISSYAAEKDITIKKGEVLWRALFESHSGNEWNYNFNLSSRNKGYLQSEIYADQQVYKVTLQRAEADMDEVSEVRNDPNPWLERTTLSFDLPRNGMVELELYDAQNRLIYSKTKIYNSGSQKWIVSNKDISHEGVYFGKLNFEGKTRVFKMIKIE